MTVKDIQNLTLTDQQVRIVPAANTEREYYKGDARYIPAELLERSIELIETNIVYIAYRDYAELVIAI